jgi:putative tricarboxylic transport membrane protein
MERYDRICSVICLVFAGMIIWLSFSVPMGRISKPGPAFLPFWVAVTLALLSILLWVEAGMRKGPSTPVQFLSGEKRWSSVMMTVGSLLGYAFLMEYLGFLISTLLLLLFLFRFIGNLKWWVVFTGMVLVTLMTHVLFKVALKVQLPGGLFRL